MVRVQYSSSAAITTNAEPLTSGTANAVIYAASNPLPRGTRGTVLGISIAIPIGALLLVALIYFWLDRRRRTQRVLLPRGREGTGRRERQRRTHR